jgi:hypothetical protein
MSDVKLIDNAVIVEGNIGVGTATPVRPFHAECEVHSGGPSGGYSFADRHKSVFIDAPQASGCSRTSEVRLKADTTHKPNALAERR